MNETTEVEESTQSIKVRLEVTYDLRDGRTILDATDAAKELLDKAREYGSATGQIVFGRQKFPLR